MNRRDKIQLKRLATLEAEFNKILTPCLKQCANGRWGLFGAYERFPEVSYWTDWPEARRLHQLALSIREVRGRSGEQNEMVEGFLKLRTMHKPNDPGEPKLAQAFLDRIESDKAKRILETGSGGG